jgi:ABC-type amino acid transport substrate-binding protein
LIADISKVDDVDYCFFASFQKIKTKTWSESISFAKMRKCDIYSLAMATPERKQYMRFTTPYLRIPLVVATKPNITFVATIDSLSGKTIGIVKDYAFNETLREKYSNINIVDVKNIDDGLQQVVDGKLFGFIGSISSIGYKLQNTFLGELKISGKFDERWELGIAVRNDEPILFDLLQKAVDNLTQDQKQKIY